MSVTLSGGMVKGPRTWSFADDDGGATLLTYETFQDAAPVAPRMVEPIKEYVEGTS